MITAILAGSLLLAAEGSTSATTVDAAQTQTSMPPRPIARIERDISSALRNEAKAKDPAQQAAAVEQLCRIHAEIVADARYTASDALKKYRARLWSRLLAAKQRLQRDVAEEAGDGRLPAAALVDDDLRFAAAAMASSLSLADFANGAPSGLLARGGAAQTASNAQALIELIERTIDPDFWDVNGGPGTIVYYPNLQCLVIRATSEVHGKIGGVLGGAREAGR